MLNIGDRVTFKKPILKNKYGEILILPDYKEGSGYFTIRYLLNDRPYCGIFEEQELNLLCLKDKECSKCKNRLKCLTIGLLKKY